MGRKMRWGGGWDTYDKKPYFSILVLVLVLALVCKEFMCLAIEYSHKEIIITIFFIFLSHIHPLHVLDVFFILFFGFRITESFYYFMCLMKQIIIFICHRYIHFIVVVCVCVCVLNVECALISNRFIFWKFRFIEKYSSWIYS
mgnify:CR=1 FL=1